MESRLFESRPVGAADPKAKNGKLVEVLKTNCCGIREQGIQSQCDQKS